MSGLFHCGCGSYACPAGNTLASVTRCSSRMVIRIGAYIYILTNQLLTNTQTAKIVRESFFSCFQTTRLCATFFPCMYELTNKLIFWWNITFSPTGVLTLACTLADVRTVDSEGTPRDGDGYLQVCQQRPDNLALDWVLVCSNESNLPNTNAGTSHAACMQLGYAKVAFNSTKSMWAESKFMKSAVMQCVR